MDELFTGTNPKEGIAGSFGVCQYLGSFKNNVMIITTHFKELTNLEKSHKDSFKNMKFSINELYDGSFRRPYKIEDGVSNQNIAIKLLKQKGYHESIINGALDKLDELASYHNNQKIMINNKQPDTIEKITIQNDNLSDKSSYKQDSEVNSQDSFDSTNIETTFSLSEESENLNNKLNYIKNNNVTINNNLF